MNQEVINKIITRDFNNKFAKEIAENLNSQGYLTLTSRQWTASNVSKYARSILKLEKKRDRATGLTYKSNNQCGGDEMKKEILPEIINHNNRLLVSSLNVAEVFNKQHKDVIRSIENLDCDSDFTERNFTLSDYKDGSGKQNKMYMISKDGLTFLVMGYTGKKAAKFKLMYISEFNRMEDVIKNSQPAPKQMTQIEMLLNSVQLMADLEKRQIASEERQGLTEQKVNQILYSQELNRKRLNEVERSNLIPYDKPTRAKIRELVYSYIKASGLGYSEVWNKLYMEMLYRYRIDVFKRSEKRKISKLDCIQDANLINELYAVASEILIIPEPKDIQGDDLNL